VTTSGGKPRAFARRTFGPLLRRLVPAFPIASGLLGLSYCFTPRERWLASPVFSVADSIMPMPVWGAAFLTVAAILSVGMACHRRTVYEHGLAVLIGLLLIWAVVFGVSALDGLGSYTAALWPALVAWIAWATLKELTTPREGNQ
jgi:hypothetical protein